MDKDKMIADIIVFVMMLLFALFFVCGTWFSAIEPRWLDLFLRLSGSLLVFILGTAYRDWQREIKNGK